MRRSTVALSVVLLLATASGFVASVASAAAKKAKAAPMKRPPVTVPAPRADTTTKKSTIVPARVDSVRTMIAPYPVPLDTARDAAKRGRILNLPKSGTTTIAPLPQPVPTRPLGEQGKMSANAETVPKWGDYVQLTELPEAIVRVPPSYPAEARAKGIQGTVMVRALVIKDGTVREAHAVEPLPYLDGAAESCVLQWRFKPAKNGSTPVAVWVSIPVKFTLH